MHKSIVNPAALDDEASRYQLLETLRAYARERLEEGGEADDVRRRHAGHYAERAAQMQAAALTGVGVGAAFRLSVFDTDDTRAAISWALDSPVPEDAELALRIAARLSGAGPQARLNTGVVANADRLLARRRGRRSGVRGCDSGWARGRRAVHRRRSGAGREACPSGPCPRDGRFVALLGTAAAYSALIFGATARGRFDDAREVVAEGMRRFETDHARSYFEYHTTRIELTAGDAAAARRHAEEAVSLARRAEFPARLAQALCMLGQVTVRTDPRTARPRSTRSRRSNSRRPSSPGKACTTHSS